MNQNQPRLHGAGAGRALGGGRKNKSALNGDLGFGVSSFKITANSSGKGGKGNFLYFECAA